MTMNITRNTNLQPPAISTQSVRHQSLNAQWCCCWSMPSKLLRSPNIHNTYGQHKHRGYRPFLDHSRQTFTTQQSQTTNNKQQTSTHVTTRNEPMHHHGSTRTHTTAEESTSRAVQCGAQQTGIRESGSDDEERNTNEKKSSERVEE